MIKCAFYCLLIKAGYLCTKNVCPSISWWKKIVDIKFAEEDCNVFVSIDQWLKTFIGSSIDEYHFHGKYCFFIT